MSEQRQMAKHQIEGGEALNRAIQIKYKRKLALAYYGFVSSIFALMGMGIYIVHLHQESDRATRLISHLEIGQAGLVEDRDFFTARVLDLEADLGEWELQGETGRSLIKTLLQERQNLQQEIREVTKNVATGNRSLSPRQWIEGTLEKTIAERDARIATLTTEVARLQVLTFELANAVANHQATAKEKIANVRQEKGET